MRRRLVAWALALSACACGGAVKPPVAVTPAAPILPPAPSFEQKQSWILRLEDQRVLRDPASSVPALADGQAGPDSAFPPPDLLRLLTDGEARIRYRAALAVGHVGLRDGVLPLVPLLSDPEPQVRQIAAFALGLLADPSARDALVAALADQSPLVRGSAAEALGLIGDAAAAEPIARMAASVVESGALAGSVVSAEDRDTPAAAFRLAIYALVRLKAYEPLAGVVLDGSGQPRVRTWPVAFALQRLENPRALPALLTLAGEADPYTRAFAVKGLGALKDRSAIPVIVPLVSASDRAVAVEAIRALGRIGDPTTAPALIRIIQATKPDPVLRLEAVSALGGIAADGVFDHLLDLVVDPSPVVRAAVLRSLLQLDQQALLPVLSGLDPDPDWRVRAALAGVLGGLPPESAMARLRAMLQEQDQRVVAAVVTALGKVPAPEVAGLLIERLKTDDAVVRAAAAAAIGELKPVGGAAALTEAYQFAARDVSYVARAAALAALTQYGPADATAVLTSALQDKDWAVRLRAAALLKQLDPATDAETRIRPAPTMLKPEDYRADRLTKPAVSPQVYIETDRGVIQLELAVLDAPLTVENFVSLARKGFFDGLTLHRVVPNFVVQTGDPRGDSEGGPGYSIRDELNERPYLRGTVGMALDWADTGGSQFFIAHSPQPHLDAKYTVFGRVVSGMDVVDQIQPGDVMRRVRIADGT